MSQTPTQILLNSNQQWAQKVAEEDPHFLPQSAKGQSPKVLWIGCSDSRVPESVIAASKPGDIFVHRNIANQFHLDDDSALSVLAYALKIGVQHVVLVGHTHCGGAIACLEAATNPPAPDDTSLTRWLTPLTDLIRSEIDLSACSSSEALNKVIEANVRKQVDNICKAVPMVSDMKKVTIHGWVYDLASGRLRELVSRNIIDTQHEQPHL